MIILITIWLKQISHLNVIFKSILASLGTFYQISTMNALHSKLKNDNVWPFLSFFFLSQIFCALFFYHLLGSRSSQRNRTRWEPCARKQICAWVVLTESYCQPFSLKIHFFSALFRYSVVNLFFFFLERWRKFSYSCIRFRLIKVFNYKVIKRMKIVPIMMAITFNISCNNNNNSN